MRRASMAAIGLTVIMSATVLGTTWDAPVQVNQGDWGLAARPVGLGGQVAVAAYADGDASAIRIRRTTDSGESWGAPLTLATSSLRGPEVAGLGQSVDVVWTKGGRLRYARSTDGGVSFAPAVALSPASRFVHSPEVAHGPGGVVAVLWEDDGSGDLVVRVSSDGGTSFGAGRIVGRDSGEDDNAIAIGQGVILVAYRSDGKLRLRRSLDQGGSWKPSVIIHPDMPSDLVSLVVSGNKAFVGYSAPYPATNYQRVVTRRSTDKGATWGPARPIASDTWLTGNVQLSLAGGVLRAAFERCFPDAELCVQPRVQLRESTNGGQDWGPASRVSPDGTYEAFMGGITYAGAILVTWTSYIPDGAFVRRGS